MHRLLLLIAVAALSGCLNRPLPPAYGPLYVEIDIEEFESMTPAERRDEIRVGTRRARCTAAFARVGVPGGHVCR